MHNCASDCANALAGKAAVLSSLQHVYRRGHIFWWRRVHRLFDNTTLDVRLSLRTSNRRAARDMGAALSAATPKVVEMLSQQTKRKTRISESELQAIAKAMYEERLAEVCTDQRSNPHDAEFHSAANRALVDYFQRLRDFGGHMSFLPAEQRKLEEEGWPAARIADLRAVIAMREERGISPIRPNEMDRHLAAAGFQVDEKLRWMLELALYPAYRDVYADAERQLKAALGPATIAPDQAFAGSQPSASSARPDQVPANGSAAVPEDWLHCSPTQAAERMIAETPKLLEHRKGGKREKDSVGEQTIRQIRWAAALLEKSLPSGTPFWKVTKADILELDRCFDRLSVHYGKSPRDRDLGQSLEAAAELALEQVGSGALGAGDIGLSTGTANKHYNKLAQIHVFMRKAVPAAEPIDFSEFTVAIDEDERDARERYTREQGRAIFRLPPWTGCRDSTERLEAGSTIIHDGLFYLLLLVWYTGARREELAKLMLDDVEARHGIDYLLIRPTITGRLKNKSARRVVVVAEELIRLGFLRYVQAMRAAGERLLFPEFVPGGDTKRKIGDVFYKLWWMYIAPSVPDRKRGQAMHAARHTVSDELKDQEVFVEFRNDLLGHKGKGGEGETRYPSRASLEKLKATVEKIPVVTNELPDQKVINLLPAGLRKARPTRGKGDVA
jgi:integrase